MTQKRDRTLVNIILILAVVALIGVSMIPLFGSAFSQRRTAQTTPSPTQVANPELDPAKRAELEAQARGYELVLQREPENQAALRGLLEARLQLVDIPGTIPPLEKLAELNPDQTNYAVLLAQAKQYAGDREGAATVYRQILASKPGDLNALQGFVDLQLQQNRPEAAIGLLQETLATAPQANQIQPGSVDTLSVKLLLGRVYAAQERYDEAIAIYDRAIEDDRADFRPVLGKAIILKTQGNNDQAKPLFESAASLAPAQYRDQIQQLATAENPLEPQAPQTVPAPSPDEAPQSE
ncbi:tetratricopeptide repeat protein [Desertifilum sp. FACHB-1129]|uniref:Tetratricopeptide repeat protein n=1 Tax=Desertifilum tharense IPPAS B-1220 TaxID=1781255 RepID=A0ACD5H387_9CYAN|nr:tetratricopeptide repeat protein [Desertifilum tharense]MBD2311981.1 tetratricopeptide repeat protein [Desertifilum sp. FACHB-1129]MBD2322433.1 tetratricopeptide repeat protein [Desertifilum sp. FACHB-866]MBD2332596.1 tetratricopeptide repeat protein [Desertifilum sp. FACHB-868]